MIDLNYNEALDYLFNVSRNHTQINELEFQAYSRGLQHRLGASAIDNKTSTIKLEENLTYRGDFNQ